MSIQPICKPLYAEDISPEAIDIVLIAVMKLLGTFVQDKHHGFSSHVTLPNHDEVENGLQLLS